MRRLGIGNELIDGRAAAGVGPIECTERIGGLLYWSSDLRVALTGPEGFQQVACVAVSRLLRGVE